MASTITAAEQLLIELTNRARLDPMAEAALYGIDLNDGLSANRLNGQAKQVVAPNQYLETSARGHAQWMLAADTFSHTGAGGSTINQRIKAAGYDLSGSFATGENITWIGSSGTVDMDAAIAQHHANLFLSSSHRVYMLYAAFREVGVAQEGGLYTMYGWDFDSSMVVENFGKHSTSTFLTGVVYDDLDGDGFYSIGEGIGGTTFSIGKSSAVTASAGGYGLEVTNPAVLTVDIASGSLQATVTVDLSKCNVKLDLVDGDTLLSSGTTTLVSGIDDARLLGTGNLLLNGTSADNVLTANAGNTKIYGYDGNDTLTGGAGKNVLFGNNGKDILSGMEGADKLMGGNGDDLMDGGTGNDRVCGQNGNDRMTGGDGDDTMDGGGGNDVIFGEAGNDFIDGNTGNDVMTGGAGADTFFFRGNFGQDVVTDLEAADTIRVKAAYGEAASYKEFIAACTQVGNDLLYDLKDDGVRSILFVDTTLADLAPGDFIFL